MSLTIAQARDAISSVINSAWLAAPVSAALPMLWDNVKGDRPGEDGATTQANPWARTTLRIITSPQVTQGARRFETTGAIVVQIFTPTGDGHALGDQLMQVMVDALRAHVGGIGGLHFFDIVPNEIGPDGPWFNVNVNASVRFQAVVS